MRKDSEFTGDIIEHEDEECKVMIKYFLGQPIIKFEIDRVGSLSNGYS
jgi:hypothetical protein